MPSPQKQKGKGYENDVAKHLTQTFGSNFMRSSCSGAYLGGQNRDRRITMTSGQIKAHKGDIIPPDDWHYFNCEVKFYKDFKFHQLFDESKTLESWIKETLQTSDPGDLNLIFMKFNRIGEFVAYQSIEQFTAAQYTVYRDNWCVTSKEQFWNSHNQDIMQARSTGNTLNNTQLNTPPLVNS
jgi:hypothetical protein